MRIADGVNLDRFLQKAGARKAMRNVLLRSNRTGNGRSWPDSGSTRQPRAALQHYNSYRNAGPRSKSMVTMEQMMGGRAAPRAAPEGEGVRVVSSNSLPGAARRVSLCLVN